MSTPGDGKGRAQAAAGCLDAELVVLVGAVPRPRGVSLDELAEGLEALAGGPRSRSGSCSATPARCSSRDAADLPVDGIGIDFYATHLTDVPEGFSKLLLAGVVDVRSSLLEEPRELASFAGSAGAIARERIALVPNGRPPVRARRDRAPREATRLVACAERDDGGGRSESDVRRVPHARDRLARQAALARQDLAGASARRRRHRARPLLGREGRRRRPRGARRVPPERERRPGRGRPLVEPLLPATAGIGRGRGRLGRRAAAQRDVRLGDRALDRLRASRHDPQLRQQVLLQVGRGRARSGSASRTTTRSSRS